MIGNNWTTERDLSQNILGEIYHYAFQTNFL